jgi:hypothetical protein
METGAAKTRPNASEAAIEVLIFSSSRRVSHHFVEDKIRVLVFSQLRLGRLPIETGNRKRRVRQPGNRDVVEDVVVRETFGLANGG